MPLGCLSAVSRSSLVYLSPISRLALGWLSAGSRPPLGCLSAASRLPLGHLSAASRLPLSHLSLSAISRLSLGCSRLLTAISRLPFGHSRLPLGLPPGPPLGPPLARLSAGSPRCLSAASRLSLGCLSAASGLLSRRRLGLVGSPARRASKLFSGGGRHLFPLAVPRSSASPTAAAATRFAGRLSRAPPLRVCWQRQTNQAHTNKPHPSLGIFVFFLSF